MQKLEWIGFVKRCSEINKCFPQINQIWEIRLVKKAKDRTENLTLRSVAYLLWLSVCSGMKTAALTPACVQVNIQTPLYGAEPLRRLLPLLSASVSLWYTDPQLVYSWGWTGLDQTCQAPEQTWADWKPEKRWRAEHYTSQSLSLELQRE